MCNVFQKATFAISRDALPCARFTTAASVRAVILPITRHNTPHKERARQFWTATYILMGLRYNKAFNSILLEGVRRTKESVTYQAMIEEGVEIGLERGRDEGRLIEARRMVLRLASRRLGPAPVTAEATLEAVAYLEVLEGLLDRVFEVESWDELLRGVA